MAKKIHIILEGGVKGKKATICKGERRDISEGSTCVWDSGRKRVEG